MEKKKINIPDLEDELWKSKIRFNKRRIFLLSHSDRLAAFIRIFEIRDEYYLIPKSIETKFKGSPSIEIKNTDEF